MYDKMQSVLLIGQSNMVGVGLLSTVDPIEDDRLFMLRNDEWVKMKEPLHTNTPRAGAGIGASFGKAFVDTFGCKVGIIPAAKGTTTLAHWAVGGDLYNEAVRLAKVAQRDSEIAAILWHQGEGDQRNPDYAKLLKVIFDNIIKDLGLDPDKIVIITGELFGTRSDAVHMGQLVELGKHYKKYGIALSDNLTVVDITTHFDAPSLRVFGYRYFALFYNLVTGKTFEFDDNPEHYWSSQIPSTEYVYLPFDDMLLGNACTGYAGSGKLVVTGAKGVGKVKRNDEGGRFFSANNFVEEEVYPSAYFDSKNNTAELSYGGVVAVQSMIKIGEEHNTEASIFEVHTENSDAVYHNFSLSADGWLSTVDTDGNKKNVIQLNTTDWVTVKVILDTERNLKDVYLDDRIVLRGVKISDSVDPSRLVIDFVRFASYDTDGKEKGSVHFDDFRFSPYFDNLQPAE